MLMTRNSQFQLPLLFFGRKKWGIETQYVSTLCALSLRMFKGWLLNAI